MANANKSNINLDSLLTLSTTVLAPWHRVRRRDQQRPKSAVAYHAWQRGKESSSTLKTLGDPRDPPTPKTQGPSS